MDYGTAISKVVPGTFVPDLGTTSNANEAPVVTPIPGGAETQPASFKDTVKQILTDVNDKLTTSDQNTRDLATGKTNDLQKVVTSVEEANLALNYTIAIRQKLLDAYQEIARMQV